MQGFGYICEILNTYREYLLSIDIQDQNTDIAPLKKHKCLFHYFL